jgi:type VI secretion system protein ImpH
MPTTKRQPEPGVITRLLEQPHRFRFVQSINILLADLQRAGVSYERAFRDVIRFRNNLSLSFPASEIQALEVERKTAPAAHDASTGGAAGLENVRKIRITPAFIGLLGAAGTLPLHDSERLAAQQHLDRDASQHELIDVFSNRMIGLFYETWGKYRVEHGLQIHGKDGLLPMLVALAGHRPIEPGHHVGTGESKLSAAAYYAGILRTRPVSASAVERVLCDHFGIPVRVEPLVGCWDEIPPARRSTFGGNAPVLGRGAVLGTRLWRHDMRARVHIGPLDETALARFLPGGASSRALSDMMAMFAVPMLAWELKLLLGPPCVKRLTLTTKSEPRKLGWNSFLTGTAGVAQRAEVASILHLPASKRDHA